MTFAHPAERQLARLLDFYGVDWLYEPHTFVLATDTGGRVTEAFTPDFYLPAHDVYVEVTTLRQKLVTKKHRKVRRLAELRPELRVQLLYQRDVLELSVRFGLEPPGVLAGYGPLVAAGEGSASLLDLGAFAHPPGSVRHRAGTAGD